MSLALTLLAATGLAGGAHAQGVLSTLTFTGDSDSGISSSNTYTHAIDLNGSGETINGVTFVGGGAGTPSGLNYTLGIVSGQSFTGNTNTLTGSINQLAKDFFYSGASTAGNEALLLTNLTPSTTYKLVFYSVAFGSAGGRTQSITDSQGLTATVIDQNQFAGSGAGGQLLIDTYTTDATGAGSTQYQINFNPTPANGGSFHQYGFSNQVVPAPEPSGVAVMVLGLMGVGTLAARKRRTA